MTKMIKMSLVAAVAVAGFTTSASAMDTSYTGKLYVENHATTVKDTQTVTGYDIDFDVKATTKINDNFTAIVGIQADADRKDDKSAKGKEATVDKNGAIVVTDKKEEVTGSAVTMDKANLNYANNGFTLKFGRQGINTPTTDGETGEGVLATYAVAKGITLAAAHFGNNKIADTDAHALAVLGSVSGVNFQLWNVGVAGVVENNTISASTTVEGIALGARYAMSDFDTAGVADGKTAIVTVGGKVSDVSLSFAYLVNGSGNAAFTTDASSANTAELVKFSAQNTADVKAFIIGASAPVSDTMSASLKYGSADVGSASISEVVAQLNNNFAKNLTGSVRYAAYSGLTSASDQTQMRADLKYSF